MLKIQNKINLNQKTSGMDTYKWCRNKNYFKNYKKEISYSYNSKGFRDKEWPKDLSEAIWCVGNSFTVGMGQPFNETWPQLLERATGKRCINVAEDGCSNDVISKRIKKIHQLYKPKWIVVMWSYLHRRQDKHYDKTDFGLKEDLKNFKKNYDIAQLCNSNIIHLLIPDAIIENTKRQKYFFKKHGVKNIHCFSQIDYGRDYQHFGLKTSKKICSLIVKKIKDFDKRPK